MIRIAVWATSFQADMQALAYHLAAEDDVEVVVAMPDPATYEAQAVSHLMPFPGTLVDRGSRSTRRVMERFRPHVVLVDNHVPPYFVAPRAMVVWHGLGWRVDELDPMLDQLGQYAGEVRRDNPNFRWAAFGERDRRHRIERWGIAPENVVALGAPFSDWLLPGSEVLDAVSPTRAAPFYPLPVDGPQTVLLAPTWHFGGLFDQWGDEFELVDAFLAALAEREANVIFRLHDRRRYPWRYRRRLGRLLRKHPHVYAKFKDEHPDSLVDLAVSDVAVSNYSSILNSFYYTRRPSVHIDPLGKGEEVYPTYRRMRFRRVQEVQLSDPVSAWKLPFSEIGGLRARSFEQLLAQVTLALDEPACCEELADAYIDRNVTDVDGRTCERVAAYLRRWID